jgi:GNAT superfamily N-acetyltransferase
MTSVEIRKCTVAEIAESEAFPSLWQEYADESAMAGLPYPSDKLASYYMIEGTGIMQPYGAYREEQLIGFVVVMVPVIPHYGVSVGVTESLFVAKAHRKTGAGIALIRTAEQHVREAGGPALLVSAPFGGRLAEVLPRIGYRETNRVFMRRVVDE